MKLKVAPPIDPHFTPMAVVYREFTEAAKSSGGKKITLGVVRNKNYVSVCDLWIYADGTGHDKENFRFVERVVKTLLWTRGGWKIIVAGSKMIYEKIKAAYDFGGLREFDRAFMARVYERPFEVEYRDMQNAPVRDESAAPVGRHLSGNRIGFDAGGSDRKVSAVVEGEGIYSEEVIWHPKTQSDPSYHFNGIYESLKTAADKFPKKNGVPQIDGIGVSSAGVYIDNKAMVGSLFVKVPDDAFEAHVKNIYTDAAKKLSDELGYNIPIEVANDGDVTALAGAMAMDATEVLGIAMGTSEAGGYVDAQGNITGWLNELAFVPVDYCNCIETPDAPDTVDEWSGDWGCGVRYFSQECVIKLAPFAGIEFSDGLTPAEKLKYVQDLMKEQDERAASIYESIGVYFGYAVAYYALFYDIKHVLLMGRVTSGDGGTILLHFARKVLRECFPELADKISVRLPDEKSRRVGQSIAAASLPV